MRLLRMEVVSDVSANMNRHCEVAAGSLLITQKTVRIVVRRFVKLTEVTHAIEAPDGQPLDGFVYLRRGRSTPLLNDRPLPFRPCSLVHGATTFGESHCFCSYKHA